MTSHVARHAQRVGKNGQGWMPVTGRGKHTGIRDPDVIDSAQAAAGIVRIVDGSPHDTGASFVNR